jgi:ElaB/YqjD/DUF883 family membrane-anchored ribosome-binding protein
MFSGVSSRREARRAARALHQHPARVANEELKNLISTLEDLIERLSVAADPEVKRLRRQAETALTNARAAVAEGGAQLGDQAGELVRQGERYVHRRPWSSLGFVALCMLAVGLLTGRSIWSD